MAPEITACNHIFSMPHEGDNRAAPDTRLLLKARINRFATLRMLSQLGSLELIHNMMCTCIVFSSDRVVGRMKI
jgi:hypothetical protein